MRSEKLLQALDAVAQELVTADPENLQDLGKIYDLFQSILEEAERTELKRIAEAVAAISEIVKKIMMDEDIDRVKMFEAFNDSVSSIQHIALPGFDPEKIVFPEELGIENPAAGAKEATAFSLPTHLDVEIFNEFLSEQDNVLENIENHILKLEKSKNAESVAVLRRIFHTLKGEAGVFELKDIEACCHQTEDLIDASGDELPIDKLLTVKDWLKDVFDALKSNSVMPPFDQGILQADADTAKQESVAPAAPRGGKKAFHLPEYLDEDLFNEFIDDQDSVLENMESCLLTLEKGMDTETIADLRRIFHTLKGESGIFELVDVERVCHLTEDLIDESGDSLPIDKFLSIKDWLKDVFDALKKRTVLPELSENIVTALRMGGGAAPEAQEEQVDMAVRREPPKPEKEEAPAEEEEVAYAVNKGTEVKKPEPEPEPEVEEATVEQILISADLDLLSDFVSEVKEHIDNIDNRLLSLENTPEDPDLLNAIFRVFHTIKGAAGFLALDEISRLAHTTENLLDMARKGEVLLAGVKVDVIFEAVDEMKKLVNNIEESISTGSTTYPTEPSLNSLINKIQKVLAGEPVETTQPEKPSEPKPDEPQPVEPVEPVPAQQAQAQAPEPVEASAPEPATPGSAAPEPQPVVPDARLQQQVKKIKESIKVDSENLDKLIDAIGELVIIESMIRQDNAIRNSASSSLLRNVTQMDKITRELQQLGMSLRMIPVKATFQKMARVVRDLAKKSGKKIEFVTHGEDTMLDKSVVDRIGDPLIHLVRNSVDHGIEAAPDDRKKAGKSETGKVELTSFHKGGNIYIEIRDDGRGLNKDRILQKATEKGLARESQTLSDREIFDLVFLPGFSTAKKVTDVSGRGVGMDVVKRTIEDLRGNIEIFSEQGKGSTFSLRLPLTLAIIDGMLVGIGEERYIIPTLSIVESIRPRIEDISTIVGRGEMIKIRDNLIPLFRLANLFDVEGAKQDPTEGIVIVVEDSGKMTGLLVDELLGQQSTVIKSLGASMKGLLGISGGSIMSDGRVGIILDIAGIVKLATSKSTLGSEENTHPEM